MARIVEVRVDTGNYRKLLQKEAELKKLTEEVKELRDLVLQEQVDKNIPRIVWAKHVFEVATRSNWKYSPKVAALKAKYKAQAQYEIDHKIAVPLEGTTYLKISEV